MAVALLVEGSTRDTDPLNVVNHMEVPSWTPRPPWPPRTADGVRTPVVGSIRDSWPESRRLTQTLPAPYPTTRGRTPTATEETVPPAGSNLTTSWFGTPLGYGNTSGESQRYSPSNTMDRLSNPMTALWVTVFVAGSTFRMVPPFPSATHTPLPSKTNATGQQETPTDAVTVLVAGSIRDTVPIPSPPTQTLPAPYARPVARGLTEMVAVTVFVLGSIRDTHAEPIAAPPWLTQMLPAA